MYKSASIRSLLLLTMIGSFVVPPVARAATDTGTLTVGLSPPVACSSGSFFLTAGFGAGGFGSYSPTGLTGGQTLVSLFDLVSCPAGVGGSVLQVSGFSSDPGVNWLASVTCGSVTNFAGSGSYIYDNGTGTALWTFSTPLGFYRALVPITVSCTIEHN